MANQDRRTAFNEAIMVEKGIWLASHEGVGPAIEYMHGCGISNDVALRVLAGPEFQRNSADRRKCGRH